MAPIKLPVIVRLMVSSTRGLASCIRCCYSHAEVRLLLGLPQTVVRLAADFPLYVSCEIKPER